MRNRLLLVLPICLGGCASFVQSPSAATYEPLTVKVLDQTQFEGDKSECRAVALKYQPGVDVGSIASQAAQGAADNVADSPLSPYIPLAGALGSAGGAVIGTFDLNGALRIRIFLKCLDKETAMDRSAIIADPGD